MRRRADLRRLAKSMGLPIKPARTPFAAYARGRLDRMLLRERAALRDGPPGLLLGSSKTGKWYYTIARMAHKCGRSTHVLRRLDHVLKPVRVRDVFPKGKVGGHPLLPGDTRLYLADPESVEHVKAQVLKRSRARATTGEKEE